MARGKAGREGTSHFSVKMNLYACPTQVCCSFSDQMPLHQQPGMAYHTDVALAIAINSIQISGACPLATDKGRASECRGQPRQRQRAPKIHTCTTQSGRSFEKHTLSLQQPGMAYNIEGVSSIAINSMMPCMTRAVGRGHCLRDRSSRRSVEPIKCDARPA